MNRIISSIIVISVIIIFFNYIYSARLKYTPFHSDEILWPCLSSEVYNLLVNGDWRSQLWTKDQFSFAISPIPRYIYGWWIDTKFDSHFSKDMNCQNYSSYFDKSLANLNQKQITYLYSLRNLNKFFALLVLVLSFILFKNLFGKVIGIIGVFFLGFNPLFSTYATRSMAEMIFMFTLVFGLLLIRIFQTNSKLNPIVISTLISIWSGITAMTKLYGIMLFGVWLITLFSQKITIKKKLIIFGISVLSMFVTIIAVYPPFLMNPLSIGEWSSFWISIYDNYRKLYPITIFNGPVGFLYTAINRLIYPGNYTLFHTIPILNILLVVPEIFALFIRGIKKQRFSDVHKFIIAVILSFVPSSMLFFHILTSMIYFQMHWDRYFLPLIFGEILLQLFTLQTLWLKIKSLKNTFAT